MPSTTSGRMAVSWAGPECKTPDTSPGKSTSATQRLAPSASATASAKVRHLPSMMTGCPEALLIPVAFAPGMANVHVYGPIRFAIVAVGLVGYLFGASVFTSFREPPPPLAERPLTSAARPMATRWRRRFRIYAALTALSAVFPVVLLYTVNFDVDVREALKLKYQGKVAPLSTVMNLGAIAFWVAIYAGIFLGVLRRHRTGDRDLVTTLERLKRETRRARPRPQFYLGVAVALGLMVALLLMRGF